MKKIAFTGIMMILAGICWIYKVEIRNFVYDVKNYILYNNVSISPNEYYREENFEYVQITDNFKPNTKKDLINIFYTFINSGMDTFKFYCPSKYTDCLKDVHTMAEDESALSHLNNFVHPYNTYDKLDIVYTNTRDVSITVKERVYEKGDIAMVSAEIDKLLNKLVVDVEDDVEKIKILHDYIVNNTVYDSDRSDFNIINYKSDIAYGPLFEGYGICGGYSDTMALFLDKLDIKNYKISNDDHVWNAIYVNNNWYHLDSTWDDPVTTNQLNVLTDTFFLISTGQLKKVDPKNHIFDIDIYSELKEA